MKRFWIKWWTPLVCVIVVGGIGHAIEAIRPGTVPTTEQVGLTILAIFLGAIESLSSLLQSGVFWVFLAAIVIIKLLWDIREEIRASRHH
jgi:hypothetical protein